ncbi:hypothetical protein, partial [Acidisphaera rubrifaciens]|uniref:hypothetical protein n=1 Tax=Acidisphaera rubrifaciens TaxID=50715 RepID=UPI00066207F5
MSDRPLSLLLGAESLRGRRSGIGRMTAQIAQAVSGDPRLIDMHLLFGSRLVTPTHAILNPPEEDGADAAPPAAGLARRVVRAIPG